MTDETMPSQVDGQPTHSPMDVGPPDHTWCPRCNQPWPCEDWARADRELTDLREAR